jgi:hypothetical protein
MPAEGGPSERPAWVQPPNGKQITNRPGIASGGQAQLAAVAELVDLGPVPTSHRRLTHRGAIITTSFAVHLSDSDPSMT